MCDALLKCVARWLPSLITINLRMRLKTLTLNGYKTFASKMQFQFGDGITCIIGPNGSGKSNVADGIRWALGEQQYSLLRGKRPTT